LVVHTSIVHRPDGSNQGVLPKFDPAVKAGILSKGSLAVALHKNLVVDNGRLQAVPRINEEFIKVPSANSG
jgi:hypothetical protein